MKKNIETIILNKENVEYVQRLFEDYIAKKDILTTVFDLYKKDKSILNSETFKDYEKEFAKTKISYDAAMEEIRENYIPEKYKQNEYNFEIIFERNCIEIYVEE